jgi:hypothetical protein
VQDLSGWLARFGFPVEYDSDMEADDDAEVRNVVAALPQGVRELAERQLNHRDAERRGLNTEEA